MFELFNRDAVDPAAVDPVRLGPMVQVDQRGLLLFNQPAWDLFSGPPERSGWVTLLFDADQRIAAVRPATVHEAPRGTLHEVVRMRSQDWPFAVRATAFIDHHGVQVGDFPVRVLADEGMVAFEVGPRARQTLGVVAENSGLLSAFGADSAVA